MITILTLILSAVFLIVARKQGIKPDANKKVFCGVCAGIARRHNLPANVVRAAAVVLLLVTHGLAAVPYFLLWATVASE